MRATHNPIWHLLWFVIPIAGLFYNGIVRRANREKAVTTYIDRVVGYVWWVFGSAAVLCSLLSFFVRLDILFIILLLMGLATALTGLVTRFRLCVVSGMVSALLLAPGLPFRRGNRPMPDLRRRLCGDDGHTGPYPGFQMSPPMFRELNPLLHSELRLAVMSLLLGAESADFV